MDLSDISTKIQTLDIYKMKESTMICVKYLLFLLNLTFSVSILFLYSIPVLNSIPVLYSFKVILAGPGNILFLLFRNGYDAMLEWNSSLHNKHQQISLLKALPAFH